MKTVAILCAARKRTYRDIPGLEIYDEDRDCRNFPGDARHCAPAVPPLDAIRHGDDESPIHTARNNYPRKRGRG